MQKIILLAAGTIGAAVAGYFLKPKVTSFFGGAESPVPPSSVRRSRGRQRRGFSVPHDLTPENLSHAFQMTLRE